MFVVSTFRLVSTNAITLWNAIDSKGGFVVNGQGKAYLEDKDSNNCNCIILSLCLHQTSIHPHTSSPSDHNTEINIHKN